MTLCHNALELPTIVVLAKPAHWTYLFRANRHRKPTAFFQQRFAHWSSQLGDYLINQQRYFFDFVWLSETWWPGGSTAVAKPAHWTYRFSPNRLIKPTVFFQQRFALWP